MRMADIERAAIFALLCHETAAAATAAARGLRKAYFTDAACMACFDAIRAVRRTEGDGRPDCAARYGACIRSTAALDPVCVTRDIGAELGIRVPKVAARHIEAWEIDAYPLFVYDGCRAGDTTYEDDGCWDTADTVRLNPAQFIYEETNDLTESQVEDVFKAIKSHSAR